MSKHYESLKGPLFENLVIATTIGELIADGFLVDCEIYAPSEPDMSGVKTTRNAFGEIDWSDMDVANAVGQAATGRGHCAALAQTFLWSADCLLCFLDSAQQAHCRIVPRFWRSCRAYRLLHRRKNGKQSLAGFNRAKRWLSPMSGF